MTTPNVSDPRRYTAVNLLSQAGYSLAEIGGMFQVTRQRVQQILDRPEPKRPKIAPPIAERLPALMAPGITSFNAAARSMGMSGPNLHAYLRKYPKDKDRLAALYRARRQEAALEGFRKKFAKKRRPLKTSDLSGTEYARARYYFGGIPTLNAILKQDT